MLNKKSLEDFPLNGKRVLVRCDFNVPVKEGVISDGSRVLASLDTIKYLISNKAKVILMSHFGRPKGAANQEYSLAVVAGYLEKALGQKVYFADDDLVVSKKTISQANSLQPGEVLLLQNTRFRKEEEANDPKFSKELASLGDLFINDAFGAVHRAHASTVGVAQWLPAGTGYLLKKELDVLGKMLDRPERPFLAIVGGAKVSDKIDVIEHLLDVVDTLIIGGGMQFTFHAALGKEIGKSILEEDKIGEAKRIMAIAESKGVDLILPEDAVVSDSFSNDGEIKTVSIDAIPSNMMGLDIGPKSIERFSNIISRAKTVLWNGPMGVFEMSNFSKGTFAIAQAMADCPGVTVVGGGDSAAAVDEAGLVHSMTHVSTGGGASLVFLKGDSLPGVVALDDVSRKTLICGNWKMNTTIKEGLALVTEIDKKISTGQDLDIVVCPPFTHLYPCAKYLKKSDIGLGAQNVSTEDAGAYTGEISAVVLEELNIKYCLIGHSERRLYDNETDKKVALKAKKLLEKGITPIICCGESLEKRESGQEKTFVKNQIKLAFKDLDPLKSEEIVVAYEPIWAIGTGKTATKEQACDMCAFIRESLNELGFKGANIRILYGGSVSATNAEELLESPEIDGALIGGACLKYEAFSRIIEIAKRIEK